METTTGSEAGGVRLAGGPAAASAARQLPAEPLVTVEPSGSWRALDLAELWSHRELLYFLTWRDLKVRYKQTLLGVAWVVMQPLLMTVVFTVFLGMLARVPTERVPYPLFVYAGLLPWTFFSGAVVGSGTSLVSNSHLITKVYFPRLIVPAAAVGARLIDFCVAFTIIVAMMIFYRVPLTANLLLLPPLLLLATALALGCGLLLSAVNVRYRDIGVALPVFIQLWMFVSPVLYPTSLVPESWRGIYALNPLVGIIDNFRAALFGGGFNWTALAISAAFALVLLVFSAFEFKRVEKSIADVI
jgi:lipopolysaccharide transport system permease protein